MTFLSPLALAFASLAVPIVLMYVLRLRRRELVVPSTLLWRRVVDEVQARASWRPPRPNLLLLLQLLALAALVLALARPAYIQARAFDGDLVVIVDQSYGMQARDVPPSRFAEALVRAHHLAGDLAGSSVMSVIGMGAQPHLAVAESSNRDAINRAIDSLHVDMSAPNFPASFSLAASLGRKGEDIRVIVLTSRDSGIDHLPLKVSFPVEIERIGRQLGDLGITAFRAGRADGRTQAVLRVRNFGTSIARSDLDLFADRQLVDVRPIALAPGAESSQIWVHLPPGIERLQAHLTRTDDNPADKSAWAVTPTSYTRHVVLVSNGDYFLQTALALDPSVALDFVAPREYTPRAVVGSDLVVFDRILPKVLPAAPVLLIAPQQGQVGALHIGAERSVGAVSPVPSVVGAPSSLLRYVDLSDVHVARARDVTLPAWVQPVMTSGETTLVAAGDDGRRRVGLVTFDLQESDWPLRMSFPIVMENLLNYLTPGLALGTVELTTGQPLTLFPGPGAREIQIIRPDGKTDHLRPPFAPFTGTGKPGIYTAREVGAAQHATVSFAVNFTPVRSAPVAGPAIVRVGRPLTARAYGVGIPVGVGWACGLLALTLLLVEWRLASRG